MDFIFILGVLSIVAMLGMVFFPLYLYLKSRKRYDISKLEADGWRHVRNIYGDEINMLEARSVWRKGNKYRYSNKLYTDWFASIYEITVTNLGSVLYKGDVENLYARYNELMIGPEDILVKKVADHDDGTSTYKVTYNPDN